MSRPLPRGCAGGVRGLEASIDTRCSLSVTRSTLTLSSTAVRKEYGSRVELLGCHTLHSHAILLCN